jgi:hypothetical protein
MLIIFASRKVGPSERRSATNTQCRCAAVTIAKFTAAVMKPRGGKHWASTRLSLLGRCGCRPVLCRQETRSTGRTIMASNPRITKPSQSRNWHDVVQAVRGQSTKRAQKHRPTREPGKERSRNTVRHGLTAETVVTTLEDEEDYKAFELSVTSGFDAPTGSRTRIRAATGKSIVAAPPHYRCRHRLIQLQSGDFGRTQAPEITTKARQRALFQRSSVRSGNRGLSARPELTRV